MARSEENRLRTDRKLYLFLLILSLTSGCSAPARSEAGAVRCADYPFNLEECQQTCATADGLLGWTAPDGVFRKRKGISSRSPHATVSVWELPLRPRYEKLPCPRLVKRRGLANSELRSACACLLKLRDKAVPRPKSDEIADATRSMESVTRPGTVVGHTALYGAGNSARHGSRRSQRRLGFGRSPV